MPVTTVCQQRNGFSGKKFYHLRGGQRFLVSLPYQVAGVGQLAQQASISQIWDRTIEPIEKLVILLDPDNILSYLEAFDLLPGNFRLAIAQRGRAYAQLREKILFGKADFTWFI